MDFSGKTNEQLEKALVKAMAANDGKGDDMAVALISGEIDRRAAQQNIGKTNVADQTISQFYKSLSNIGTPVDMAAAGLEKIGLRDSENPPVGGSESIQNLIQTLSGGEGITNIPPQNAAQRIGQNVGDVLGDTAAVTTGLMATVPSKVAQGSSSIYSAFKNILAKMKGEAKQAPATFAAVESGAAVGGGLAEGTTREVFGENPTAEMIANIVGSLSGGKAVSYIDGLMRKGYKGPLTSEALKTEAGNLYEWQIDKGLSAQPNITEEIYDRAFSIADRNGMVEPIKGSNKSRVSPDMPVVKGQLRILEAYADKGMTGANIMSIRRGIMNRMMAASGPEKNVLRNILREFDNVTGELTDNIRVANAMYHKAMKADQIEEMMLLAQNSASAANNDMENAIRIQYRQLLNRIIKGQEVGWSQDEVKAIEKVVQGGPVENLLRYLGKFAPTGVVSMYGGGGAGLATFNVTQDPALSYAAGGTVMATGAGAKAAGAQVQKANVDKVINTIMQGRNISPEAADKLYSALTAYYSGQALSQGMNQ